jgi:hypothetical protein
MNTTPFIIGGESSVKWPDAEPRSTFFVDVPFPLAAIRTVVSVVFLDALQTSDQLDPVFFSRLQILDPGIVRLIFVSGNAGWSVDRDPCRVNLIWH